MRAFDVGAEDGAVVAEVFADGVNAIVADDELAIDHARIAGVMGVATDAAGEDGAAGVVGEDASG